MDLKTLMIAAGMLLVLAVVMFGLYFALRSGQKKRSTRKPAANREGLVVAARLVRDKATGLLLVAMDGNLYTKSSELTANQRQRLVNAALDLHKWLEQPAEQPPAAQPVPAALEVSPPPPLPVSPDEPLPVRPVSTNPLDALAHNLGSSKPAPAFRSITMQINDILQSMLVGTPLEKQGISLVESPSVGVVVRVGIAQYPGIDAVPDDEIRRMIRSAVVEWEKRNR